MAGREISKEQWGDLSTRTASNPWSEPKMRGFGPLGNRLRRVAGCTLQACDSKAEPSADFHLTAFFPGPGRMQRSVIGRIGANAPRRVVPQTRRAKLKCTGCLKTCSPQARKRQVLALRGEGGEGITADLAQTRPCAAWIMFAALVQSQEARPWVPEADNLPCEKYDCEWHDWSVRSLSSSARKVG